jgi:hypothetical protein
VGAVGVDELFKVSEEGQDLPLVSNLLDPPGPTAGRVAQSPQFPDISNRAHAPSRLARRGVSRHYEWRRDVRGNVRAGQSIERMTTTFAASGPGLARLSKGPRARPQDVSPPFPVVGGYEDPPPHSLART